MKWVSEQADLLRLNIEMDYSVLGIERYCDIYHFLISDRCIVPCINHRTPHFHVFDSGFETRIEIETGE